jgi:phosphatidylglycerophosphate synthase
MSKLPAPDRFIDLSDYGRALGNRIAKLLLYTKVSPKQVTMAFLIAGLIGVLCILIGLNWAAAFFLILKSILDAADGTLARLRNTPSYVGRYFDSISDILLNFLILLSVWFVTEASFILFVTAFIGIQLQGTLYNYYYAIVKQQRNGDTTSRVKEHKVPVALAGETQKMVNYFFYTYKILYGFFDFIIYTIDRKAVHSEHFPNWYLTALSIFGLGFQLLLISAMLVLNLHSFILPVLIFISLLLPVFVFVRLFSDRKFSASI